jgi:hypothetical protein
MDRGPGPDLGDYTGLPINDAGRLFAESWDASRLTLQEHQCRVHVAPYIFHGPLKLRIWQEKDPMTQQVIAIKNYISTYEQTRTIWMDGRPHPSAFAPHTFMGFSTGRWEGHVLVVTTTHLKQGLGAPQRRARERSGDALRAVFTPWQRAHARRDHHRSGVSRRADDPDDGLRARHRGRWR